MDGDIEQLTQELNDITVTKNAFSDQVDFLMLFVEAYENLLERQSRIVEDSTNPPHLFASAITNSMPNRDSNLPIRRIMDTTEEEMGKEYGFLAGNN